MFSGDDWIWGEKYCWPLNETDGCQHIYEYDFTGEVIKSECPEYCANDFQCRRHWRCGHLLEVLDEPSPYGIDLKLSFKICVQKDNCDTNNYEFMENKFSVTCNDAYV